MQAFRGFMRVKCQQTGRRGQEGFTLVLVSALIIVLSIAAASFMLQDDVKKRWSSQADAQAQLNLISQALRAYQRANHRLPCVAPMTAGPEQTVTAATAAGPTETLMPGQELPDCVHTTPLNATLAGTERVTASGETIRVGAVPTQTLGLPASIAVDPWGNKITYVVTENLTDPYQFATAAGVIRVSDGSVDLTTEAGYILIVHGPNQAGAHAYGNGQEKRTCASSTANDNQNCDFSAAGVAPRQFISRGLSFIQDGTYFDDRLLFEPADSSARSRNRPCTVAISGTASWTVASATCTNASWPRMLNGTNQPIARTGGASSSGSVTISCTNGSLTYASQVCNP